MAFYVSPGAYFEEVDLSIRAQSFGTTVAACIVEADDGEAWTRVYVTSPEQLDTTFGSPKPNQISLMSARRYLRSSAALWVVRVTRGAKFGGVTIARVRNPQDQFDENTIIRGWVTGEDDVERDLIFSDDMICAIYPRAPGNLDYRYAVERNYLGDGGFYVHIYRANEARPIESHLVSLEERLDGNGNQMFIETKINGDATSKFRALVNRAYNGFLSDDLVDDDLPRTRQGGGLNSEKVTSSDVMRGVQMFRDAELVDLTVMINAGWTDPAIQINMDSLAQERRDFICVLDMPTAHQELQAAIAYRNDAGTTSGLGIDSSYSAIYTPDVLVSDESTGGQIWLPPSADVAARYAFTDTRYYGQSPAGMTRGYMPVLAAKHSYDQLARDELWKMQVNTIRRIAKKGLYIWGDTTMQTRPSALQYVNVRRNAMAIEKSISQTLLYFVFDPNDPILQQAIKGVCEQQLDIAVTNRQLLEYLVVCDIRNNPKARVDQGELTVWVLMRPTLSARIIRLVAGITSQGAAFSEATAQLSGSLSDAVSSMV